MSTIREDIVRTWAWAGIQDFYLAYRMPETVLTYANFLYHQGLEKIGKAYILGIKEVRYKFLPDEKAKGKIEKIAKDLGHDLQDIVEELISYKVLKEDILDIEYGEDQGEKIKGIDVIEILESAYLESRYPVPMPLHRKYGSLNPLHWSAPADFAIKQGVQILGRIEDDFEMSLISDYMKNNSLLINSDDFKNFCSINNIDVHLESFRF